MTEQLQNKDVDRLVGIMATFAFEANDGHARVFKDWLQQSNLPPDWIQSYGKFPTDAKIAARQLIRSLHSRGTNKSDRQFQTLGSFLYVLLPEFGIDQASIIAAFIVRYNLIHNKQLLNDLIISYQIPLQWPDQQEPSEYGPEIVWQEPLEDLQLQGLFRSAPDFLDLGFLMRGIQQAVSVCRVERLDGQALGTGFLIDDNLLLTNHHVLQHESFASDDIITNAQEIRLRFGCFTAATGQETRGQTFRLDATQPVVHHSSTEQLDYVLLRVDDTIGQAHEIRKVTCDFRRPLSRGMGLTILQHPHGETMKLAVSQDGIHRILTNGLVQYATKAAGGSSGSPCFNEDWQVVALHHAERSRSFGSIREGILLSAIYPEIKPYLGSS